MQRMRAACCTQYVLPRAWQRHASSRRLPLATCALTLALLYGAPRADAATPPEGQRVVDRATALFEQADFASSLKLLEGARSRFRDPRVRARIDLYIGLNHAAEDRLDAARAAFKNALEADFRLRLDRDQHKELFVRLFESVRQALEVELEVRAGDPGGLVTLDGVPLGTTPFSGRVLRGRHVLEVRSRQGVVLLARRLDLRAGQRIVVRQEAESAGRRASAGAHGPLWTWGWISLGGAVAAAAVAGGFTARAFSERGAACELLADPDQPCGERLYLERAEDEQRYRELRDAVESATLVSTIGWVTSGVLAATAALLLWLDASR